MISVIIPLHNKEQSIAKTLESVFNQSYTDYEVIVVNDGSTDGSRNVVENFISLFPLGESRREAWRLVHKPNGGVSSARNRGIEKAKGEYVAFLDGDDLWHPEFLEEMNDLILKFPDAAIYGIKTVQVVENTLPPLDGKYIRAQFTDDDWSQSGSLFTGSSTCIRRDVLEKVGMFDTRMTHGEDLDLWWRILTQYKGAYSTKPLAYYRQDAENRAMHRLVPIEKHIPYYIDKFSIARSRNSTFRKYFDTEMIYKLYPYLFDCTYRDEAKRLSKLLDYSQLKWSLHLRIQYPWIYRLYESLKKIITK